jgi:hypothetical protein
MGRNHITLYDASQVTTPNGRAQSAAQTQSYLLRPWRDHTPLGRTPASLDPLSRLIHHRRFEPSLNVQQRPLARYVFPDGPHQQRVVDVVKQAFDVKLQNPVVFPATLTRHSHGIERRLSRPVPVGVC